MLYNNAKNKIKQSARAKGRKRVEQQKEGAGLEKGEEGRRQKKK
jgi:hypothetical protein